MCESFEKGCREHLSVSFTKSLERLKGWMGGQVEVNKEMAGMEREEMRVVPCEDDLELSQGVRERNGERYEYSCGGEKARYPGIE